MLLRKTHHACYECYMYHLYISLLMMYSKTKCFSSFLIHIFLCFISIIPFLHIFHLYLDVGKCVESVILTRYKINLHYIKVANLILSASMVSEL